MFLRASFFVSAIANLVSGFPDFDMFHSNCEMKAVYPDISKDQLFDNFHFLISSWEGGCPSGGFYKMYDLKQYDWMWTTRTTPIKKYVDDQKFEFKEVEGGIEVHGRSRSQTLSYYDYETNFCNLWNPMDRVGGMDGATLEVFNCPW